MITFVSKNYTMQKCQILHNKKSVDILIPIRFVVHNVRQTDTAHQKTHRSVNQERFRTLLHTTRRNNENMTNTSTNLYDQYIHKSVWPIHPQICTAICLNDVSISFQRFKLVCLFHLFKKAVWTTYDRLSGLSGWWVSNVSTGYERNQSLFNYTHQHMHIYYYLRSLKFTLIHLKRSYMFRSHNHPQGAYIVPR